MSSGARDRIVEATLGLITDRGLGGVTMSAVAEASGVARQTLYNHFPDVDAIVVAVMEEHASSALDQLEGLLGVTPDAVGKLGQLVRHSVAMSHHGADVAALSTGLSAQAKEQIGGHEIAYRRVIAQVIEAGITEGVFRADLDPEMASMVVGRALESGAELTDALGEPAEAADLLIGMLLGSLS